MNGPEISLTFCLGLKDNVFCIFNLFITFQTSIKKTWMNMNVINIFRICILQNASILHQTALKHLASPLFWIWFWNGSLLYAYQPWPLNSNRVINFEVLSISFLTCICFRCTLRIATVRIRKKIMVFENKFLLFSFVDIKFESLR